jgi:hypothetical protein
VKWTIRSSTGNYLLVITPHRRYHRYMTVFRHDYDLLTGMLASAVALSWAETIGVIPAVSERQSSRQPRCFRLSSHPSAPAVGVRPGRKQGPEEKSHKNLNLAVCPARNVA